jgi:thioredoxin 1
MRAVSGRQPTRPEEGGTVADVQHVTDASFDTDVMQADVPVLIDFWAPWCGPCKAIAPVLDELAKDYAGRLKIVKMNVDDNQNTPSKFGVRSIPNLLLFKGGQVKEQIVGAVPKAVLVKAIDQVV